jgi:prevent-host-death family protein
MRQWQLQQAKARLSEVLKLAEREGPQEITLRGEPKAVVVSTAEFERLRRPKTSLTAFLRSSPLAGLDVEMERDKSPPRDVAL